MPPSVRSPTTPSIPIGAACVVLVRPTPGEKLDSYEVLLVERMARDGSQFLNAHVFPGGQVDASDNNDIRRAALRELYEEASIYLLPDQSSNNPSRVIPENVELDTAQTTFSRYLEDKRGPTAESSLIPLARWITPKLMRKRFDTHFFLALSSSTNAPVNGKVDGQEIKSLAWVSPAAALDQFSEGKITLFPPQWHILSELKMFSPTFTDLLNLARRLPPILQPMAPQGIKQSKSGFTMVFHGDEAYKPSDDEPKSQIGGRHRIVVEMESGRPRRLQLEIKNFEIPSKL